MRTGIAARSVAVLAALAGGAAGLAACGTPAPSLTFTPVPSSASASPAAPAALGVVDSSSGAVPSSTGSSGRGPSGAASSGAASPAASGSRGALFPDARHAAMAFRGTYRAQLLVISASGSVSQDLGAIHAFTWHVAPDCGGSCVRATSTSHATFTLTYRNGEFDGAGGGISHCLTQAGKATGAGIQTTLTIALVPATSATPITALAGIEQLTVSGGCSGSNAPGSEVIQYTLTRTSALPQHDARANRSRGRSRSSGGRRA
jgi:hypothetical protein